MRRVYRAHEILSISVNADGDEMSVDWSFRFRDTAPQDSPVRNHGGCRFCVLHLAYYCICPWHNLVFGFLYDKFGYVDRICVVWCVFFFCMLFFFFLRGAIFILARLSPLICARYIYPVTPDYV